MPSISESSLAENSGSLYRFSLMRIWSIFSLYCSWCFIANAKVVFFLCLTKGSEKKSVYKIAKEYSSALIALFAHVEKISLKATWNFLSFRPEGVSKAYRSHIEHLPNMFGGIGRGISSYNSCSNYFRHI